MFGIGWSGLMLFGVWFRLGEMVLLILAAGAIATIANRRGGDSYRWGGAAVLGYAAVKIGLVRLGLLTGPSYEEGGVNVAHLLLPIAWVAATGLAARFWLGRGKPTAGEKWICPECKYLNDEKAVVCEACGKAYEAPPENGGLHL